MKADHKKFAKFIDHISVYGGEGEETRAYLTFRKADKETGQSYTWQEYLTKEELPNLHFSEGHTHASIHGRANVEALLKAKHVSLTAKQVGIVQTKYTDKFQNFFRFSVRMHDAEWKTLQELHDVSHGGYETTVSIGPVKWESEKQFVEAQVQEAV